MCLLFTLLLSMLFYSIAADKLYIVCWKEAALFNNFGTNNTFQFHTGQANEEQNCH